MEPGLHIGLPEAEYLADPALGSSDLKLLRKSPCDWWWQSPHNPEREERESNAGQQFGSALHAALLEGLDTYEARYQVAPDLENYPDALRTADDIRDRIRLINEDREPGERLLLKGNKDELMDRLLEADPTAQFWDDIAAGDGRTLVKPDWDTAVRRMQRVVSNHPDLSRAFTGGLPEVSVFWDEDGIRFRARFDYLKPAGVIDLKSFANQHGREIKRAVTGEIANRGYDLQSAHYLTARKWAKIWLEEGRVFCARSDPNDSGLLSDREHDALRRIKEAQEWTFVFVFLQTIGAPLAFGLRFDAGTIVHGAAEQKIAEAVANYRNYAEHFGLETPWLLNEPIWAPQAEDWPSYITGA